MFEHDPVPHVVSCAKRRSLAHSIIQTSPRYSQWARVEKSRIWRWGTVRVKPCAAHRARRLRSETVAVLEQVALALACAHAAGVVHRDLKPGNIMIGSDGHVRVLDFGLAALIGGDANTMTRLTGAGTTLGTAAYMAPEQVRGEVINQRADVWALGVTLYKCSQAGCPSKAARPSR